MKPPTSSPTPKAEVSEKVCQRKASYLGVKRFRDDSYRFIL